jgi:hypothetical protein
MLDVRVLEHIINDDRSRLALLEAVHVCAPRNNMPGHRVIQGMSAAFFHSPGAKVIWLYQKVVKEHEPVTQLTED